jgi:hypothetical protein
LATDRRRFDLAMKKVVLLILTLSAVLWAGSRTLQMNAASAQTNGFAGEPFSLTDLFGFTNTVVQVTNTSSLQLNDLVTLLLNLQTNVEETLPVVSTVLSNAVVADTNFNTAPSNEFQGAVGPITSNPASLVTPSVNGAPQSFSLTVGTNTFIIDPPTLQALVILRNNLERTLPVLQALNGTTPQTVTNPPPPVAVFPNLPVTSLAPPPITNMVTTPLTNQSQFVGALF